MTQQEQITQFLDRYITLPRMPVPSAWNSGPWLGLDMPYVVPGPRPTADQVAQELLKMSEFRALKLGTWLGTTNGQVISKAVETVTPPFYRQDVELLVAALQLATKLQYQEGQDKAGKVALGVLCGAGVLALGVAALGSEAA
jgi:hypothetical protein